MNDGSGRVPPSDLDAEAAVLSAVLLTPESLDEVAFLDPKHFYADANRRIFAAALDLREQGKPIDVVTVAGHLRDQERLQQVGGSPYLAQLSDATPAVAHVEAHAKTIVAKWEVRQIIFAAQQIATEGYGDIGDVEQWKQEVDRRIQNVVQSNSNEKHLMLAGEATKEAMTLVMQRFERKGVILTGVTTGLPTLDARFGGLEACKNYVFAARPGQGKTALVTGLILSIAKGKRKDEIGDGVVFVSLEMPRIQIMFRFLSQLSRVDSVKIQRGKLDAQEIHSLKKAAETLAGLPIAIEDSSDHTPASLRAAFRQGQRKLWDKFGKKLKVKALGIDYLQLMGSERESQNREAEIAAVSRSCKAIAKSEEIAVLTLAQVNRDCEKRPDKRPILADLRESGAIEQDADVVTFIYRDDVYKKDDAEKDNKAELIVRKLRDNGGPGTVYVNFNPTTMSFFEGINRPDLDQLGDIFDDELPLNQDPPADWHDDYDR